MILRSSIGFFILISSIYQLQAQSVSWNYTKSLLIPDLYTERYMIPKREGGFNLLFYNQPTKAFLAFDINANLKDVTKNSATLVEQPSNSKFTELKEFNGIYQMFTIRSSNNNTEQAVYTSPFSLKEAKAIGEPKFICKKNTPGNSTLDLFFSEDKKTLLVDQIQKQGEEELPTSRGLSVYNENFEEQWTANLPFANMTSPIKFVTNPLVTNGKSVAFVMVELGEMKKGKRLPVPKKEMVYKLMVCTPYQPNGKIIQLPTDNHILRSTRLVTNVDGDILFFGYYANEETKDEDRIDGIYSFKIDVKTGTITNKEFHEFSNELLFIYTPRFNTAESENKNGKDNFIKNLNEYFDYEPTPDGGFLLVSQVNSYDYVDTEGGGWRSITVYHFKDVIVSKINKDGKVEWETKVPKNQSVVIKTKWTDKDDESFDAYYKGKEGYSFNFFTKNGYTYILHVDLEKNEALTEDKSPTILKDIKKGKLYATKIDPQGRIVSKDMVMDYGQENIKCILPYFRNDEIGGLYGLGRMEDEAFFMNFTAK